MTAKNRGVVDLSEVAAKLGVSRTTAWRWCSPGRIPELKVLGVELDGGDRLFVTRESWERWLGGEAQRPAEEAALNAAVDGLLAGAAEKERPR